MTALLAIIALAQTMPHVTMLSRGETVKMALADASKQTGVTMEAAPQTRDDIVIFSVKDVPLDAFREHVATAIGARWRNDQGVLRLGRPQEMVTAQEKAERDLEIKAVASGMKTLRQKVAAQASLDAPLAETLAKKFDALVTKYKGHLGDSPGLEANIAFETQTPAGRFAIAAVASLSPAQIVDVAPGERIVYSTNPTRMQQLLPGDLSQVTQRFQTEQELYTSALERFGSEQTKHWAFNGRETSQPNSGETAGMILITERSPYNPNLTVHVRTIRGDGTFGPGASSLLDLPVEENSAPPLMEGTAPLSAGSLRFIAALDQFKAGKTFLSDRALLGELTHPEVHDPLSYIAADGVFTIANQQNVIACLPDSGFIEPAFDGVTPAKTLDLRKFSLWLTKNCEVTQASGWMVASPRKMVETRSLRVDRDVLGQFFRKAIQESGASLEDMAQLVVNMPSNYMDSIVPMLAFFVLPDLNAGISDRNVELLRVYGRMTNEQRIALQSGKPVQVQVLNEASHADLNHLIYRADAPMQVEIPQGAPNAADAIDSEITCALPNGVPEHGELSMNGFEHDAVLIDGGDSNTANYQPMDAGALAYLLVSGERADPNDARQKVQIDKYRFGHARTIEMRLELTSRISADADIHVSKFSRKDDSVPYAQLPADFRKAVEAAMVQARAQPAEKAVVKVPPPLPYNPQSPAATPTPAE